MRPATKFEKYLIQEIRIEMKACLYFFCTLFFYSVFQIFQGSFQVSVITIGEMILFIYLLCYIQVYLFRNFDEAPKLGGIEITGMLACTLAYGGVSYFFHWFQGRVEVTIYYMIYQMVAYLSIYLTYRIQRNLESKELNALLKDYKNREGGE